MRKPDASWAFPWSLRRSASPDSLNLTRHSLNQRAPEDTSYRPRESFLGSSGASDSTRNFRDRESGSKDYKRVSTNEKGSAGARFPKHNVSTWTALADAAAVMLPLGVLIFIILVWRLHGTRTTEETDRKWRNAITVPDSIQVDTMDHWGNVKIPFLDQNAPNNWTEVPRNSQEVQYSSLAGIPLKYSTVGNVTFAVESSYVHLDCNNITKFPISFPQDNMTNITSGFWANSHTYSDNILKAPNGTWRGVKNHVNNTQNLTTWAIALDRFVDPFWADQEVQNARLVEKLNNTDVQADVRDGLRLFVNETGIEAGEANLLLQIIIPSIKPTRTPETKLEAVCGVTQSWMDGTELTKELRSQRIRYGYTHHTMGGEPLMGVGYQADTEQIKDFIARYQDK
ncbi:hypothetical protein K4K53_000342 [Colletotrichum sp. SAR 10_77]|nr:hypothetical protein K4K53_000342 [Colletotrichum sp. SAR 10_77]